jgi:hypothetical protein
MFADTVVTITQGIPVSGLGLPAAVGIGCPGHDGIDISNINFPQELPVTPGIGLLGPD